MDAGSNDTIGLALMWPEVVEARSNRIQAYF